MDRKLISCVVCCYNSAAYMSKCIESLLKGKEKVEIIIIDDGSKDDTGKIADEYLAKYPDNIKVVHQQNAGHGAGVQKGIELATGYYFKVVDSDDWLDTDALNQFLDCIEKSDKTIDVYMTDYRYCHQDGDESQTITYGSCFPENKVFTPRDIKHMELTKYFTIHSTCYRTDLLKGLNMRIPTKVSYDDNYFIYIPLPHVKKMYYLPVTLYCYLIGREGQSVSEAIAIKRYSHYLRIAEDCFLQVDQYQYKKDKAVWKMIYHQYLIVYGSAMAFANIAGTKESKKALKDFHKTCKANNKRQYRRLRYFSLSSFIAQPNLLGRINAKIFYWISRRLVKYN